MRRAAAAAALLWLTTTGGRAWGAPPSWLATHLVVDLDVGPGWRVAMPASTPRASGFQAATVGGELHLGAELGAGVALLGGGHFRGGTFGAGGYAEGAGSLALQLRVSDRLRARLGGAFGRAFSLAVPDNGATLAGGWVALIVDILAIGSHAAVTFHVRLDVDSFTTGSTDFPDWTMALCAGLGGHY